VDVVELPPLGCGVRGEAGVLEGGEAVAGVDRVAGVSAEGAGPGVAFRVVPPVDGVAGGAPAAPPSVTTPRVRLSTDRG
jgi:hypothetical protein